MGTANASLEIKQTDKAIADQMHPANFALMMLTPYCC
jgi:hypothetical protein